MRPLTLRKKIAAIGCISALIFSAANLAWAAHYRLEPINVPLTFLEGSLSTKQFSVGVNDDYKLRLWATDLRVGSDIVQRLKSNKELEACAGLTPPRLKWTVFHDGQLLKSGYAENKECFVNLNIGSFEATPEGDYTVKVFDEASALKNIYNYRLSLVVESSTKKSIAYKFQYNVLIGMLLATGLAISTIL
jgi:hypothetical protein